jgi:hypothetical protein
MVMLALIAGLWVTWPRWPVRPGIRPARRRARGGHRRHPQRPGREAVEAFAAGDVGTVTGPVAAGYLVDTVSYGAAFGLAACVLGLAAMLGLFAPETRLRSPELAGGPALQRCG